VSRHRRGRWLKDLAERTERRGSSSPGEGAGPPAQRRARLPPRAFRSRGRGHARVASNGLRTPDILRTPTKHRRHCSMPQPRRRRHGPQPDCRRALELLAASRDGCTEAMLRAHGF